MDLLLTCKFCNKTFKRESTLIKHVCEKKRRYLAKDEKHVIIAYKTYVKFYEASTNKQNITMEDFQNSSFYNAFVKFGSFVNNVKPLYTDKFIKYIISSNVKIDKWCDESLYEKYIMDLIRCENVETALERSIQHMITWGENTGENWFDYFISISPSKAMYDIKDGKISPWIILNSKNGKLLLQRFDDVQLNSIHNIINPAFWSFKFDRQKTDTILVKKIIKEAGL